MILLVGGHIPKSQDRQKEYEYCLWKNLENPIIQKIYLFVEDTIEDYIKQTNPELLKCEKLKIIKHGKRVTFLDFFTFANTEFEVGTLVSICNADIFLDTTLSNLSGFDMTGVFIVLSRAFDVTGGPIVECDPQRWCDSQDTWIIKVPCTITNCNFGLGIRGCDNRMITEARLAGYRVIDPVTVVKSYHVHASQYRTYDSIEPIPGPYQHCFDYILK
jgi:hypothetical protein